MRKLFNTIIVMMVLVIAGFAIFTVAKNNQAAALDSIEKLLGISEQAPKRDDLPDFDLAAWNLVLVNTDKPIGADFRVNTATTADGYLFDERAASALDEMLEAGRGEGLKLVLTSAYRSYDYQDMLFRDKVSRVMSETGVSRKPAESIAATEVARPGTSEHHTGLAADIVCEYYNIMDEGYADTAEAIWLREHCTEYGFILRYDKGKEDITKIIYEPWHFRYVGKAAAQYISENDLCLEEFVALYD